MIIAHKPSTVEIYIFSPTIKYISISEIKGDIKIKFAIFDVEIALFIAFNQNKKVIPISNKPT